MTCRWLALIFGCAVACPVLAQSVAKPLITQKVDESRVVAIEGSVHPLAQAKDDRGAVADSFSAGRIELLLNRPADREAALQQFLSDVHTRGSASYHEWLTPEEFGERFGPADSDVQAAVGWLTAHGLSVGRVSKGKQSIEFTGTAGQLRDAFHTEIHQYSVKGETHYANATAVSIPAALAPLVRGTSPLNDFRAKPQVRIAGKARYSPATKKTAPEWTIPNPFGTANPYAFAVAPEDFATEYDLAPLHQAGTTGAGQTIGIIDESNIDLSLVANYQELFHLISNPPQVVIDGGDPGTLVGSGADVESYLDVELSDAVAPNATVNLYIANAEGLQDPLLLAATRAVEDNQASVLSVSFGECEVYLGNAGNQLWAGLWEQAAAQGQTVMVASGDGGSQCSDSPDTVSGLASTPWNVAVGGTDFYYVDYATGGGSSSLFWNQTNDSNLGSLKARVPEQVWNDGLGLNLLSYWEGEDLLAASGGGASNCATEDANDNCLSGYAKPAWQTGPGVPADGVRDLPDVSLFASSGSNLSASPICAEEGDCITGNATEILLIGGTSAAAPAMAGMMALVNQKYGRQGQANYTLYKLAQQEPTAFHDITLGSNTVECWGYNIPGCVRDNNFTEDVWVTTQYDAGPNYDLASGLGSVDASVLVNDWTAVTDLPTATTLSVSPASVTHGSPVTLSAAVAPASGTGVPTGNVAIETNSALPANAAQGFLTLNGGRASSSLSTLPGGSYQVTAEYAGDGVYAGSSSSPAALTVNPENSTISMSFACDGSVPSVAWTCQYGEPLALSIQPIGLNAAAGKTDGNATGSATFTVDGSSAMAPLNATGVANWSPPALAVGNHTVSVAYSGDASFNASAEKAIPFSVTKGYPFINDTIETPSAVPNLGYGIDLNPGSSLTVEIQMGPYFGAYYGYFAAPGTVGPTGTVTVCLGINNSPCYLSSYSQTATLSPFSGTYGQYSTATVTFPNLAAGYYNVSASYPGDANWSTYGLLDYTEINVAPVTPVLAPSTTSLSIAPTSFSGAQPATFTTTVTGLNAVAPTGWVYYYDDGVFLTYAYLNPGAGAVSKAVFDAGASWFWNSGTNQVTAVYQGDGNYAPSTSSVVNIAATQTGGGGDFTLTPAPPQITVAGGGSGTVGLSLTSLNNFNGVVTLTCGPSSANLSCSVNPTSVALTATLTATLTVSPVAVTAATGASNQPTGWLGGGAVFAVVFLGGIGVRKRRLALLLSAGAIAALVAAGGCGGGGGSGNNQKASSQYAAGTYTVVVNASGAGMLHSATIKVVVP